MASRRSKLADPPAAPSRKSAPGGGLAVVAIGASAGGLEAATRLIDAVPPGTGLAFILVQHLDPSHASMMVELLARHTAMTVCQAAEGMLIEPEHLYVIPPGAYLSTGDGALHISSPPVRHGARLPFDFLLLSMATSYGSLGACVVLSGTGADGSIGLLALKAQGGLVLAQDPDEAAYDGMPRSAIRTGGVAQVLPIAAIPAALIAGREPATAPPDADRATNPDPHLPKIIDLLRTRTANDFTSYKSGTLLRRVQRRMALLAIKPDDMGRYLAVLDEDADELNQLSGDLLINVTSFFRDAAVFDRLAKTVIPDLVQRHDLDLPLRVWVAGCSTGDETYSLAMLFLEAIGAAGRGIKLQVFASDIDADAIAVARDGAYPEAIERSVSPERLARFFSREDGGYRAAPELRAAIVFTAQDVLTDPPFSRLDMVSCRNLLIYLQPDAQAKVIALFHFALRDGGALLLGSAETIADPDGRFETVAKAERIYRRVGRNRPSGQSASRSAPDRPSDGIRRKAFPSAGGLPSRSTALAELGRRLVIDTYAPAALLINAADEILFSLGPTDRYLRLAAGHATHDLLAMARPGVRPTLRGALAAARRTKAKTAVAGRVSGDGGEAFNLEVLPILDAGEQLLLVCFVAAPKPELGPDRAKPTGQQPRMAELKRELETTRTELQDALHDLEVSSEEQKAANEEALSVNEEYQSTNEELLTSKEELQSLNEELTALNSQLQETLERQRTTADDLQNVLYSTNVATLFLDLDLRIRFFTPATKSLFAVIAGDVGRPLADLSALTSDGALDADARSVLSLLEPIEREIEGKDGVWFRRRILPYRAHGDRVEGVVITFTDVTARKQASSALEAAKQQAEAANAAKSRFLAAASHDLRQPLQTLTLLQGMLARAVKEAAVEGGKVPGLVARLDDTLGAMTAMLDALLDINEIESGAIAAQVSAFPISGLLDRLREEFTDHAEAKGLTLHVLPSSLDVISDPRLLEQMLRNLLSNALKYTQNGRVLVGCRRRGGSVGIEVWDTGIGIPEAQIGRIFDEFHQIGNDARERSRGLGLGLSIVRRLGELLGHRVSVRSRPGRGSGFEVEVPRAIRVALSPPTAPSPLPSIATSRRAAILVVEDDPELRDAMTQSLCDAGHDVRAAQDGPAALALLAGFVPDLLLLDYNLPNGPNGIELADLARKAIARSVPVIVLTGDISVGTGRRVARQGFVQMNKPIKPAGLARAIDRLLAAKAAQPGPASSQATGHPGVFVVDDDDGVRGALVSILQDDGRRVAGYADSEAFLLGYRPGFEACLLIDACLPGMSGIDLLERLRADGDHVPAIVITGQSDIPMAIRAMKAGASDFIEKPVGHADLLICVARALEQSRDTVKRDASRADAARHMAGLTRRQREVMTMVLAGHPSKNIAADLGISPRTVENHRASIMSKTGATSLPALARLALAAKADELAVAAPA